MRFVLFAVSLVAFAQPVDTFEAAILRPSPDGAPFSSTLDGSQFICRHHSLMMLILSAYPDIAGWKVSGAPGWLNTDFWDLTAKLPAGTPTDQEHLNARTEAMLRGFLAEEFKLKVHREKRDEPVYALVVAKGGSKLKVSKADKFSFKMGPGRYEFQHQSMDGLVAYLYSPYASRGSSRQTVDRPALNTTGIPGFFDFTLEWAPESDPTATGASLFTALEQQLGLRLQPQKSPMEFLVIDHVEKPAHANQ